jgi:adenine deaminase
MLNNAESVPFKFYFGAPSCVPATTFETSGAKLLPEDVRFLLSDSKIKYLSEMMNFPGVILGIEDVLQKIRIAKELNKPIDGHAPALRGEQLRKYIQAGITTDHESIELEEAIEKISYGMKILIREGSAAKSYDTFKSLIDTNSDMVMFCSDDKHPDDLVEGHINAMVRRAVRDDYDIMEVLRVATLNPVLHYNLDVGLLRVGDDADFIVVDNLRDFNIIETYIKGIKVAEKGKSLIGRPFVEIKNKFKAEPKSESDFWVFPERKKIKVIEVIEEQLITNKIYENAKIEDNNIVSNIENDILKLSVVNRYENQPPAVAFIKNFGLKKGALASSIGHDSHNIIAVGTSDREICNAVNQVIQMGGGMVVVNGEDCFSLPLPVAGLMSNDDGYSVAEKYKAINEVARDLGTSLHSPFMTLSFMALLVIPKLKLSDKGLFDVESFQFTSLYV